MKELLRRIEPTVLDLLVGNGIYAGILGIISLLIFHRLSLFFGVILGLMYVIFYEVHLYVTLDKALDLEPNKASKYSFACYMIRYFVMFAVLLVALLHPGISIIGVWVTSLGIKLSAYTQPMINKHLTSKIFKEGR